MVCFSGVWGEEFSGVEGLRIGVVGAILWAIRMIRPCSEGLHS